MFLRINGWPIRIRNGSSSKARVAYGELSQDSFGGKPLRARKGFLDEYDFEAIFSSAEDADTLSALLEGRGHHVGFDGDSFSDDGIGQEAGSNFEIVPRVFGTSSPIGVHGTHYARIPVGSYCAWDFRIPDDAWTVMWFRDLDFPLPQHVVVRSDGAKWLDGRRDDTATVDELSVAGGVVQFTATGFDLLIDDLVVLPFVASSSFIESFYRWTRSVDMDIQFGSDLDNVDRSRRRETPSSTITSTTSLVIQDDAPTGRGLRFIPGGASLQYLGDGSSLYLFGDRATIEFWIRPERNASGYVLWRGDPALSSFAWFVFLSENTAGQGDFSMLFAVETTSGLTTVITNVGRLVADEWNHVAFTIDAEASAPPNASCYTNGEIDVDQAFSPASPGVFIIDTGNRLVVGNDGSLVIGFNGSLSGFVKHSVVLTQDEIKERVRLAKLYGKRCPGGERPCSRFPVIEAYGDATNGRVVLAVAEVSAEPVVPTRLVDSPGWKNNVRTLNFTLRQRAIEEPVLGYAPVALFRLSESSLPTLQFYESIVGDQYEVSGTLQWEPGPFGKGRAFTSSTSNSIVIPAPSSSATSTRLYRALSGLYAMSCVVWVRTNPPTFPLIQYTHQLTHSTGLIAFNDISLSNLGVVTASFRSQSSAPLQTVSVTPSPGILDGRWHLLGFSVDLLNQVFSVSVDGANIDGGGYQTLTGSSLFPAPIIFDPADASYIARNVGGLRWDGGLTCLAFFDRLLGQRDFHYLWSRGPQGLLLERTRR